jgi:hypothetical protein
MLTGAILKYAFGKMIDKVEADRRHRNARFMGVKALFMLDVGLPLIFAFTLSLPLFLDSLSQFGKAF